MRKIMEKTQALIFSRAAGVLDRAMPGTASKFPDPVVWLLKGADVNDSSISNRG